MSGIAEATPEERIEALLEKGLAASGPVEFNDAFAELAELARADPEARRALHAKVDDLRTRAGVAQISIAAISAQLAVATLLAGRPTIPDHVHRVDIAHGGPSAEVALASFYMLRHAGEMLPVDTDAIEAALEAPDTEPDYGSYPALFGAMVGHLRTASYYLLDPDDSYAALASEPPQQETFPPLPFPRVWIEMKHLAPYMRFHDPAAERSERYSTIDLLGIGIAEVQQGRVWDVLLPFDFGARPEFFVVGARLAPDAVVDADPQFPAEALAPLRGLAVGGAHLITARNVPVERVVLPRAQRRRLPSGQREAANRIYFVNLAGSGETTQAPQHTSREYHCRWLVRGHWRHLDAGRSFCTCCDPPQIASWIEPYVKGPIGTPWKGKQIRRQV